MTKTASILPLVLRRTLASLLASLCGENFVLGAAFCAVVVLGNVSLKFIPLSFSQAIGATTPVFRAATAAMLLRTRERLTVYATLAPIVGGVVLATGFEPSFHALGFEAAIAAAVARSLKAVLQGILMPDPSRGRVGSIELHRLMSPLRRGDVAADDARARTWRIGRDGVSVPPLEGLRLVPR